MASLIPLDVLNIILDRVAPSDLATVCRTSKAVYPYSRNALYRHLHLTPRNVLNACFALCKDPSVGACVQSFILTGPDVQMSLGVIQDTLLLMPQLRTLVLTIGSYGSWILPQDNSCPFQLSTFKSEFPFVKDVRNFVSGQRELRRLWLSSGTISTPSTSISYAAGSFPQLTSIVAPLLVVQEILPGCPVRDVAASADFGKFSKKMLDCLALSHAENGVQRLSTTRQCLFHVGGQRLASTTPSLTHLNVETIADPSQNVGYCSFSVIYIFSHVVLCYSQGGIPTAHLDGATCFSTAKFALLYYEISS